MCVIILSKVDGCWWSEEVADRVRGATGRRRVEHRHRDGALGRAVTALAVLDVDAVGWSRALHPHHLLQRQSERTHRVFRFAQLPSQLFQLRPHRGECAVAPLDLVAEFPDASLQIRIPCRVDLLPKPALNLRLEPVRSSRMRLSSARVNSRSTARLASLTLLPALLSRAAVPAWVLQAASMCPPGSCGRLRCARAHPRHRRANSTPWPFSRPRGRS
jgi:hypothetical protein